MVIQRMKLLLAAAFLWPSLACAQIIYNGNSTFDANQPMAFGARSGQPAGFGVGGATSDPNASLSFTAKGTGSLIFNSPLTSGTNGDASGLSVTIPNLGPMQLGTALAGVTGIGTAITAAGARCDGVTDDTAVINAYLTAQSAGAIVYVPPGKQCLINSANLSIPANVILAGASSPMTNAYAPAGVSAILLNPSYTISMGEGAQLRDLLIQRAGLLPNPTSSQVIAAVAQWGSESSIGVTIPKNVGGQYLFDLFIVGFNTGIKASAGQWSATRVSGDDYNGVEVTGAGDDVVMNDIRFEPFYALNTSNTSGSWARPGIAFNFHDGDTLGTAAVVGSLAYMYANAVVMNNIGITQITDSDFEWDPPRGNGITGTVGARIAVGCGSCEIKHSTFLGFDTPVSDEAPDRVALRGLNITTWTAAAFYLAGGSYVSPPTLTYTGSSLAGSVGTIQISGSGITGSPVTVSYTANSSDTPTTVAVALGQAISSNQALIAARVSAKAAAGVLTVYWPGDQTDTVTPTVSGNLSVAQSTTTKSSGSTGLISEPLINSGTPTNAFVFGNATSNANAWVLTGPLLSNGNQALPSGWLVWNSPISGSVQEVTLSGIQWSSVTSSNLSACGSGQTVGAFSSDARGTITEGGTTTACTLTFTTPWFKTPICQITPMNNIAPTAVTVSTTALTITNASATSAKFAYKCTP